MSVVKGKVTFPSQTEVKAGEFSKAEAANFVIQGFQHIHSSPFGIKDPLIPTTQRLMTADSELYLWERMHTRSFLIKTSSEREKIIDQILQSPELHNKRFLKERIRIVLEEMCTNAIYHGYKNISGGDKYNRRSKIELGTGEPVIIKFGTSPNGVYLEVEDRGGTLNFTDLQKAFKRCYSDAGPQIETKESGAGLGLYMIFETLTHIRIENNPGVFTKISGWLSDVKNFNARVYSFNFFERGR